MKFSITDVPQFYQGYVKLVEGDLVPMLLKSGDDLVSACKNLSEQESLYRYDVGKWSIKDIIQHLLDAERVFVYRAMRFARNDNTELSGFDENHYAQMARADNRPLSRLLNEFGNLRASTVDFFSALSDDEKSRTGSSNGVEMSVEMLAYIISGHTLHHLGVIKERYFK